MKFNEEFGGYTQSELKKELGEAKYLKLMNWMFGQTMGLTEEGEGVVYRWDYERWLRGLPVVD